MDQPALTSADDQIERSCLDCGYSLRGLFENRCPECGRAFNPDDPETFAAPRQRIMGPLARRWAQPVGWPTHAITLATCFLMLAAAAVPGENRPPDSVELAGLTVVCWWVVRFLGAIVTTFIHRDTRLWRPSWKHWAVAPLLLGVMTFLLHKEVPLYTAFWVSQPAMNRLVREAAELPVGSILGDRWVGVYPARHIEVIPGGVIFVIPNTRGGFAYSLTGRSPQFDPSALWGDDVGYFESRAFDGRWLIVWY